MPLDLPITAQARRDIGLRVPSHKPTIDGTDVAGMISVAVDAIEKLEILVRELQVQFASLDRGRTK